MKTEQLISNEYNSEEFLNSVWLNTKHYQFYNVDLPPAAYAFHWFKKQGFNETSYELKVLNKSYYDIETYIKPGVFPDPEKAERPINSMSSYNNIKNELSIYYLSEIHINSDKGHEVIIPDITDKETIYNMVVDEYEKLCEHNPNYKVENLKITLYDFKDEKELLKTFFKQRIEEKSMFLIGFNSNTFDNPYTFNRGKNLFGKESFEQVVSIFGEYSMNGNYVHLPDYLLVDLLEMYKPVDQGGGGFGKSLPNYKLNTIIKKELKTEKLELEGGFNENYIHHLPHFLLYNGLDSLEIFKLDTKLKFLELQWSLNSYNNSIMSATTSGRSVMYQYRNNLHYTMTDKLLRFTKLNKEVFYNL